MSDQVMTFNATLQSAAAATGNGTAMNVGGLSQVGVQIAGITTATVTFEGTLDGTNWVAIRAYNMNSGAAATTATADGLLVLPVMGLTQIRARISAYTSGTITVTGKGILGSGPLLTA